ncbi:hypothetical protein ACWDRB_67900, partial [Nonomuraea sp. NPDC003707]
MWFSSACAPVIRTWMMVMPSTPAVRAPALPATHSSSHHQRGRVADEVEHIVKPEAVIGYRPTVQLGLHPPYPQPCLIG